MGDLTNSSTIRTCPGSLEITLERAPSEVMAAIKRIVQDFYRNLCAIFSSCSMPKTLFWGPFFGTLFPGRCLFVSGSFCCFAPASKSCILFVFVSCLFRHCFASGSEAQRPLPAENLKNKTTTTKTRKQPPPLLRQGEPGVPGLVGGAASG